MSSIGLECAGSWLLTSGLCLAELMGVTTPSIDQSASMKWGIEFEYALIGESQDSTGTPLDFTNLSFEALSAALQDKPGRDDATLPNGDQGIRSGYWYLEGDERFNEDGSFRTMLVKGVEIRTPPHGSIDAACEHLLDIEQLLIERLHAHALGLAIIGFSPSQTHYHFEPPLNAWEQQLRGSDRSYDGTHVTTLSYGPDINLSNPRWSSSDLIDRGRKLNWYSPYIVPFSFSSPFFGSALWHGWSVRTHLRAPVRPAVRCFVDPSLRSSLESVSSLVHPARISDEIGRLEFKAFDAIPSIERLRACCYLIKGLCLDTTLEGRSEVPNLELYETASHYAFEDRDIFQGARVALKAAQRALEEHGDTEGLEALDSLEIALLRRRTPAHQIRQLYRLTGVMVQPGGLVASESKCHSCASGCSGCG